MVKKLIILLWRLCYIIYYRTRYIYLHPSVKFDRLTSFEGYNRIHKGTQIFSSNIGRNTFIGTNCDLPYAEIGSFCSIAHNVSVEFSTHPSHTFVSTSPVFYSTGKQTGQSFVEHNIFNEFLLIDGKSCIIGNDVWIGANVTIKGGVRIGNGAIIAMGAVVTKDVEPFTIVAGIPARVVRKRFSDEEIELLERTRWWEKDDALLRQKVEMFSNINKYNI